MFLHFNKINYKSTYLTARLQAEDAESGRHNHATAVVVWWWATVVRTEPPQRALPALSFVWDHAWNTKCHVNIECVTKGVDICYLGAS